jgi:hypothetical protein
LTIVTVIMPAKAGIQYAVSLQGVYGRIEEYWIAHLRGQ